MPTNDGQAYAEAVVSLWKISKSGQLFNIKTQNLTYNGNYSQSKGQQSRLQLSTDKKYVSLTLHNHECEYDESTKERSMISMKTFDVQFFAWNAQNMEPISHVIGIGGDEEYYQEILKGIQEPLDGLLRSCKIVGRSKYVLRESIRIDDYSRKQYICWELFNLLTGDKVYEIDNLYLSEEMMTGREN